MFMPIDNLFHLIVNHDKEIYDMAFENRIIFVGPSTLMASLKTISVLWKEVGLSKNTEQIAEESGKLYDKFSLFVEDLIDVQKRLNTAMEKNTEALKKLYSGPIKMEILLVNPKKFRILELKQLNRLMKKALKNF